jgi:methyltransferase (TIGR00027 family)
MERMLPARPSFTARRTATYRAQHQRVDPVGVFDDPLAVALLGDDAVEPLDEAGPPERAGARLYLSMRARFAEDVLAAAVPTGLRSDVVLGAGLDTFGLRNPYPELDLIEVDHPSTQAWKRERIEQAGIPVPARLRFLPVDFTTDDLAARLQTVDVGPGRPALFSWLGVTYYLELDAIRSTLAAIAACGPGAGVVLDYRFPPEALEGRARRHAQSVSERVEQVGEPFVSHFTETSLVALLASAGLEVVEAHDLGTLFARYLGGERRAGVGVMGVVHARVR